ncbi:ATP-binding protein [Runella sp.]|uniref:ATP-binding protein n=1 Tax=Runella sp. TaxID=1960881 RepID=UPI003D1214E6
MIDPKNENYAYRSYIKDVYIELPDYQFSHSPLGKELPSGMDEEIFLGRGQIEEKFLNILLKSENNSSGSYLITGYRGMGKTSFVRKVIKSYKKTLGEKGEKVEKIDISFAQSNLNETDILKQITNNLIQRAEENKLLNIVELFTLTSIFRFVCFALMFFALIYYVFFYSYNSNKSFIRQQYVYRDSTVLNEKMSTNVESKINDSLKKNLGHFNTKQVIVDSSSIKITNDKSENFIKRFFANQNNPIKEILDNNNENKLTVLLAYLVLLGIIALVITYAFTIFKNTLSFVFNTVKNINFLIGLTIVFFTLTLFVFDLLFLEGLPFAIGCFLISLMIALFIYEGSEFYSVPELRYIYEVTFGEYKIYKKLKTLQERSNAAITNENGIQSLSEQLPLGFIQRKVRQYAIKNPKEIEYELIDILQDYNKLKSYKKKFIIVFDELDKVEPSPGKGFYYNDFEPSEQIEFNQIKINEIRNRKNLIINILSTLKYFITTANSKFVFIAGREMFDASLADIADRESFISSIFHHVIYVDSFLKDSNDNDLRTKGVTALVDSYLEKILIPRDKLKNDKAVSFLKKYYNFLKEDRNGMYSESQILKTIYILQNFVIYLTYRSNGSPKKLTKLIEEYIVSYNEEWRDNELKLVIHATVMNENENVLFLDFPFKHQYRFGFISYLFRPFILAQSQVIKKFSDTVLVSMPYLMDHILKFHPFAFSIENLELIPEIITNNRNPMFRFFIEELIKYLRNNHIRETELGLFDYRFFNKTANEITYISKIFEDELAAFNFSLDEMYNVKQYVLTKIKNIRNNYSQLNTGVNNEGNSVIYSIAFLNNLLGDTQYFDQEFDDSIVAYLDGLQLLRECNEDTFERIVLLVKIKLKLGLVYEKMKNNSLALAYFNDAIADIRNFVYTAVVGIDRVRIESRSLEEKELIRNSTKKLVSYSEILQIIHLPYSASLFLQEKHNVEGINIEKIQNYSLDLLSIIEHINKKDGNNEIVLSGHYVDMGNLLFYKNFVEKKYVKIVDENPFIFLINKQFSIDERFVLINEKNQYNKDYRASYQAFYYYQQALNTLLPLNTALTYHSLCCEGAEKLRFYKNIYSKTYLKVLAFAFSNAANSLYTVSENNQKNTFNWCIDLWENRSDIVAFFDNVTLEKLNSANVVNDFDKLTSKHKFVEFELNQLKIDSRNKSLFEYKINQFKNFDRPMVFWDIVAHYYFKEIEACIKETKSINKEIENVNHLEYIIFNYYLSARFYSKIGKNASFSFQLRKILQLVRNSAFFSKDNNYYDAEIIEYNDGLIKFLEASIFQMILEATSWNSGSTDRPQIYKYKYIVGMNDIFHPEKYTKYNYLNISNNSEIKEAVFFMADLKVRNLDLTKYPNYDLVSKYIYNSEYSAKGEPVEILKGIPELNLVHPYIGITSQFTRIQELDLQEKINKVLLSKIFPNYEEWEVDFKEHKRSEIYSKKNRNGHKSLENTSGIVSSIDKYLDDSENDPKKTFFAEYKKITSNSIFSLIQIINIIKMYGVNPYLSYSYIANFHRKLGKWLKHYELCDLYDYENNIKEQFTVKFYLEKMIGSEAMVTLDATSQFQIALQHYHKAKQMHSNGIAYHQDMSNFIFLEGDYDDNLYHFGIALERQKINSHQIRDRIKELEKELVTSPLYKYSSYANTKEF